ncbi:LacI family transcriptional regulator [Polymorphobacter multimanifer]|uniref:DNA-binding LacI/PurR family transcriptional regulator n=1 Tax=Polymorphobacter multimanifer TaxID=1070431 RepID=A0A841LBA0_9SPHN|nr:substrate-binding domain-containing protein [Polymorphobacter multimanifer]MBB6228941.1 DNA-binding LacI/PurR family transcriptional regulator [Polymorphobacter multimanifer]GGI73910.1 LacI family transcriptional regulator [Polymorphobacter multimanifer]
MIRTLTDLAKATGLSKSTVSRALAGNPVIAIETRRRVAELATQHGFQINQTARALRIGKAQAIGVVLPLGHETGQHPSDPFFITMVGHLADALTDRGQDLLLSRVIPADDGWLDRIVASGRTDGIIIIGQSDQGAIIDRVAARHRPLVVWGAHLPGQSYCSVGTDNLRGGALATTHLLAAGRRQLVFYGNPKVPEIGLRLEGHANASAEAGLGVRMVPVPMTPEAAYAMIAADLAQGAPIDGIVAASDTIAMMAIRALAERNQSVPGDVAVVGYDDVTLAAHTNPPLTTVRQDLKQGADRLVDLLFRRMAGEDTESVILPPELVVRGSSHDGCATLPG